MSRSAPLEGIVVVAIEQAVAAPFCSSRLADAGATVVKIERPEGDFARGYDQAAGGESSYFVWLNRGKRSVMLDLTKAEDREQLDALILDADVLIQNLKPGALEKLGFGLARLREIRPSLITCSISGYGLDGPLSDRKAYDLLIQAESGLASLTGSPESPARVGISIVDIATGATAHAAILEALFARSRDGKGCDIHVSMFDVMADWLTVPLLHHEAGTPPKRMGLAHPSIAPYGVFSSKDGADVLISVQSDREWRILCQLVVENPALATDPRFATNLMRVRNRVETDEVVAMAFKRYERKALVAALTKADIAFAEVNDMAALSRHPHLRRANVETSIGSASIPVPGVLVDGVSPSLGSVPALGEHELPLARNLTLAGVAP